MTKDNSLARKLDELLTILARMAPPVPQPLQAETADCFIWNPQKLALEPVTSVNRVDLSLITGIDRVRDLLVDNTVRFAKGLPANNVLLWGARGMGKSSLVKAAHSFVNQHPGNAKPLKLIEIHREDIDSLPTLMNELKKSPYHFVLFCDDLSFSHDDTSYKSLKAALDGGVEGRPDNVLFYATSNRRHLMPRDMIENEQATAINPSETTEENVSLSDRFGLWLGFHKCSQEDYLAMIDTYADWHRLEHPREKLHREALEWATTRGNRSGRVAWQFIQDLAGRLGKKLRK